MHLSPTDYICHCFGGTRRTARLLSRSPGAVTQWKRNGGVIPARLHIDILRIAKENSINIRPEHLIYGGRVEGL